MLDYFLLYEYCVIYKNQNNRNAVMVRGQICIYFQFFSFDNDRRSNFVGVSSNSHRSQKFQNYFTYISRF